MFVEISLGLMHAIEQPSASRLYAESCVIVWSVRWLVLFFLGAAAAFVFHSPWLAFVALPIFVISQAVAIVLAFRFRCPACQQRLFFVQGFRALHPARETLFPGIASWIAVGFDIARHRESICLHCGERCSVEV
jgi:hypothetical protein